MSVRRGEIYWVAFDPLQGSAQGAGRPALVIQNDTGNLHCPTTMVAAITSRVPPRPYPFVVILEPDETGLPEVSVVNCAQLATIHQTGPSSRLRPPRGSDAVRPIGRLEEAAMARVDLALRYSLALGE
ncbi:MAG: type II toxin-antitoxin system PemK/MazF family toxin [Chloroflexi bacterium]|nr:type II toxin-antitoxin system PemK/MazF family toxin [Chloroflexota bacterium]